MCGSDMSACRCHAYAFTGDMCNYNRKGQRSCRSALGACRRVQRMAKGASAALHRVRTSAHMGRVMGHCSPTTSWAGSSQERFGRPLTEVPHLRRRTSDRGAGKVAAMLPIRSCSGADRALLRRSSGAAPAPLPRRSNPKQDRSERSQKRNLLLLRCTPGRRADPPMEAKPGLRQEAPAAKQTQGERLKPSACGWQLLPCRTLSDAQSEMSTAIAVHAQREGQSKAAKQLGYGGRGGT